MNEVTHKYHVVAIMDTHGDTWAYSVSDWYDTVQVYGLNDANGKFLHFESDARHLIKWCADYGLTYKRVDVETTVKFD